MKKGLDPEALTGKYPPKIRMYSKYERRTDTRTYEDRKKLYEGGWEVVRAEHLQAFWKEKYDEWLKRSVKLGDAHDGPEALLLGEVHVIFHVAEDGRLHEEAGTIDSLSSED